MWAIPTPTFLPSLPLCAPGKLQGHCNSNTWIVNSNYTVTCMETCSIGTCMQLTLLTLLQCLTLALFCINSFMIDNQPLPAATLSGVDPFCKCTHENINPMMLTVHAKVFQLQLHRTHYHMNILPYVHVHCTYTACVQACITITLLTWCVCLSTAGLTGVMNRPTSTISR